MVHPGSRRKARDGGISHLLAWARFRATPPPTDGTGTVGFGSTGRLDPESLREFGQVIVPTYRSSPTIAELAALTPRAFVERRLDAANAADLPSRMLRLFQQPYALGHVADGPRFAHVVIREGPPATRSRLRHVTTLPMQRTREGWLVRLNHELDHVHLPMTEHDPMLAMARLRMEPRRPTGK
jgi:hypothetical protein